MNYGFIYETTNLITGMKYIGQHKRKQDPSDPDDSWYLGSGTLICRAIDKYGKDNFSRRILCECNDSKELNDKEDYYVKLYDAVNSEHYYNLTTGGATRLYGKDNPFYGKHHTEETKLYLRNLQEGRKHSEATKAKLSSIREGKSIHSEEFKSNLSKASEGSVYLHNVDGVTTRVRPEQVSSLIKDGWILGWGHRKKRKPTSEGTKLIHSRNASESRWINNGFGVSKFVKLVDIEGYLSEGWVLGRGKLSKH